MWPLQANLSVAEGGALILKALERGVNFLDTAEMYQTYPHIKWALQRFGGEVIIATKSTATTYLDMKLSIEKALEGLGRDRIDIFLLHASRDTEPTNNRSEALQAILDYKKQGVIGASGVASHSVLGVASAAAAARIDVVFPLINWLGLGILDGGVDAMVAAIGQARQNGKAVYAMKALAGGSLIKEAAKSFDFVRSVVGIPVVAVGMVRPVELELNLAIFEGRPVTSELTQAAERYRKRAQVMFFCKGCGHCTLGCHNGAITMVAGKAVIDPEKCLLCGYCSRECPQFAIRII
jgi:predicted aldo/keto reductase-like oxidoreductase